MQPFYRAGIPGLYLVFHFKTIDKLSAATEEELIAAEEIGGRIAQSIVEYFSNQKHQQEIEKLKAAGLLFVAEEKEVALASEKLAGSLTSE